MFMIVEFFQKQLLIVIDRLLIIVLVDLDIVQYDIWVNIILWVYFICCYLKMYRENFIVWNICGLLCWDFDQKNVVDYFGLKVDDFC